MIKQNKQNKKNKKKNKTIERFLLFSLVFIKLPTTKTSMENNGFSIIVATEKNLGIGFNNKLPWSSDPVGKEDMKRFKEITTQNLNNNDKVNVVIMGRKTFNSIPLKHRPLVARYNCVISSSADSYNQNINIHNLKYYLSLDNVLDDIYANREKYNQIFVIGGEQVYREAINRSDCEYIYLSTINVEYECDRFFPPIPNFYKIISNENISNENISNENPIKNSNFQSQNINYVLYQNNNYQSKYTEYSYLNLLVDIMKNGELKPNRTSMKTISVFGRQIKFCLENKTLPLLTTKRMFYRGVVEELLFFLRGDHDNRKLQAKNIHIWDGNTSREYLDKYNKNHIETHDLGLGYSTQWRAAGAKLENINTDYRGKGIDQLAETIDKLKNDPFSRRIIINAWNVPQLKDMALVPCHMMYQFHVSKDKKLSCMMTQRSADTFLGLPFNIASTATLTHILAKVCGLIPHEIIINLGDTHIYENHIDQVKTQLSRTPYCFPNLDINKDLNTIEDIESLEYKDFKLINYNYHPSIKAEMVV